MTALTKIRYQQPVNAVPTWITAVAAIVCPCCCCFFALFKSVLFVFFSCVWKSFCTRISLIAITVWCRISCVMNTSRQFAYRVDSINSMYVSIEALNPNTHTHTHNQTKCVRLLFSLVKSDDAKLGKMTNVRVPYTAHNHMHKCGERTIA